jgi:hypothetical protein
MLASSVPPSLPPQKTQGPRRQGVNPSPSSPQSGCMHQKANIINEHEPHPLIPAERSRQPPRSRMQNFWRGRLTRATPSTPSRRGWTSQQTPSRGPFPMAATSPARSQACNRQAPWNCPLLPHLKSLKRERRETVFPLKLWIRINQVFGV